MAVVLLYFNKLNPFQQVNRQEKLDTMGIWYKVIVGVLPAAVIGLLFDDWLNEHLYNYWTVALMLILYGVLFIIIEDRNKNRASTIRIFLYHMGQPFNRRLSGLSLIPGTSRSGATIWAQLFLAPPVIWLRVLFLCPSRLCLVPAR